MSGVLELSDLTVVRGGNNILDSVSWSVQPSERWVVLGPNAASICTLHFEQ